MRKNSSKNAKAEAKAEIRPSIGLRSGDIVKVSRDGQWADVLATVEDHDFSCDGIWGGSGLRIVEISGMSEGVAALKNAYQKDGSIYVEMSEYTQYPGDEPLTQESFDEALDKYGVIGCATLADLLEGRLKDGVWFVKQCLNHAQAAQNKCPDCEPCDEDEEPQQQGPSPKANPDSSIAKALRERAAKEEAQKPHEEEKPEWAESMEAALAEPLPKRVTVESIAASIREGGYPKTLTFAEGHVGTTVTFRDEDDLAAFWKAVFSNLPKEEYAALGKEPLTAGQIIKALTSYQKRAAVAQDLVANGIDGGAREFRDGDGVYVIAKGLVIDLDGSVVCDVSDLSEPFGPDEWMEVSRRING